MNINRVTEGLSEEQRHTGKCVRGHVHNITILEKRYNLTVTLLKHLTNMKSCEVKRSLCSSIISMAHCTASCLRIITSALITRLLLEQRMGLLLGGWLFFHGGLGLSGGCGCGCLSRVGLGARRRRGRIGLGLSLGGRLDIRRGLAGSGRGLNLCRGRGRGRI